MRELILIQVYGPDRPGLTANLCAAMASYDIAILDIGQSVIHESLSLGMLISIPPTAESAPVIKELLFTAHKLGVDIRFTPVDENDYSAWVEAEGKPRHIVTLLGRQVTAKQVAAISQLLAEHNLNIDVITRLTGRPPLGGAESRRLACVEFSVRGQPHDINGLRGAFLRLSGDLQVDIAFQEDSVFRRNRRLVAFDMDSTLIQTEVIDELAVEAGVGDQVKAITESAMRGEIDFKQSLRRRLRLLKGLDESRLQVVADRLPMTEGAERLIVNLKRFGYKIAIISGGFTYFGELLKKRLGIDYLYANRLAIEDGVVTGEVVGEIVDATRKAEFLKEIAMKENISLQQVIAVGDGANDLPMLNLAGLGIAFHAKPVVKKGARQSISTLGLDSILYLVGVRERDIVE
ncbi:phosphoserine phosphatase SerB [Desulfovibrio inopinatus]|uniref:phosphoserine phosphatase SerB n=1 Tax=Desulfovibrio inopinatus TaxID=102109 RepID=UPI00047F9EC5|nr:phosphoserine phosphatase SerB [Desulfovibrio inopinatus]